jgi:RNA polymerase sigma factor (TIGR02999 family)
LPDPERSAPDQSAAEAGAGVGVAAADLLPLVYDELRKLARARMEAQPHDHTLQATALVHEAYLRLLGGGRPAWANRAHFFHAAAEAMRRILIDYARAKAGPKRGGGRRKLPLDVLDLASADDPEQILALEEAVSRLDGEDAGAAQVVRLRFYAGMSVAEVAEVMGTSPRTVKRDWAFGRAYLLRALGDGDGGGRA